MLNEILSALKAHQVEGTKNDGINVGISGGINVGINEQNILTLITNTSTITVREMANVLGMSLRQCERLVANMKCKNLIKRIGSNKSGFWEIMNQ